MKKRLIHTMEDGDEEFYISIGRNAPWRNNIYIRIPRFVFLPLNKFLNQKNNNHENK